MAGKVRVIPATLTRFNSTPISKMKKRRVAAYARVSTDEEEQLNSYETQVNYYTQYIQEHSDWEFVEVYSDEGISGTHVQHREGFKRMIDDAIRNRKIDLILTKSVSRFARNTVDSLTTIRELKNHGVEVYFEKENIWTFDSKGEMLLTIMSSIAQEEARSISENVLWGIHKRYEEGKYSMPYKSFLGYDKGEDGKPCINEEQARTVKYIFRRFLEGKTPYAIAHELIDFGWKTGTGKCNWTSEDIVRILKNEKYAGHAMLQKSYKKDLLSKRKQNNGEVRKIFIQDDHEAIISQEEFDMAQRELELRKNEKRQHSSNRLFSSKIICGHCGSFYGSKVWHSTDKYRRVIWRCNEKYNKNDKCDTPHLTDEQIQNLYLTALNELIENKDSTIEDLMKLRERVLDVRQLEEELEYATLEAEIALKRFNDYIGTTVITEKELNDGEFARIEERFKSSQEKKESIEKKIIDKKRRGAEIGRFIERLESCDEPFERFSEEIWYGLADTILIKDKEKAVVRFRSGIEIEVEIPKNKQ